MKSNRNLFLWALYDFANSFVLITFLFYFSQWLVIDQGKPAWWYNIALVVSSILFIVTAPFISKKVDRIKYKLGGLRFWSVLTFASFMTVSLLAALTDGIELLIVILYAFSTYAYLSCFLYFTPMLSDLSTQSDRSKKSGIGQAANGIGQVLGILTALPFANGLTLLGDPGRVQALLPATLLFGLLALPMLVFYKENKTVAADASSQNTGKTDFITMFKEVFSHKALALLLLAYFFFSDALLTFSNNFPLYLEIVHGVSDTTKSLLTAAVLILASIGAVIFGRLADKKGNLRVLKTILCIWVLILFSTVIISNFAVLVPIFLFAGILFGPIWAISRSLVGELAPSHLTASSYSYYVMAERFATLIGPALWSVALITMGEGPRGYQAGMFVLMILMIVGIVILHRIMKVAPSVR